MEQENSTSNCSYFRVVYRIFSPFNEDEVFDFINGLTMTEDDPDKSPNETVIGLKEFVLLEE